MRLTLGGSKRFSHYYAVSSSIGDNNDGDFEPLCSKNDDNNRIYSDDVHEDSINRDEGMIKLLVRKLDGTSFDFFVSGDATVGEMKSELEKTVNELEMKALGYCDIQWEQVWTNFCLCYMNQKLLDDKASLKAFGIHNDDQVEFLHHKRCSY